MQGSRTEKSIKNTTVALLEQGIYTVLSFVCRTVFINTLGRTYLGFSGLFSDILSLLSLAELGIGTAILYSMYKPAASKDYEMVAALLNMYKKVYNTIGVLLTLVGVCLTPFLNFLISDIPDLPEIPIIYLLYLFNTTASYFFIYKKSILITDQKTYISSIIYIITILVQNILQIVFLLTTNNFIFYLLIQLLCTLANNVAISVYVDRHYPYLKIYKKAKIDLQSKKEIVTNVKAMFVSKISSAIVSSTDNLLISKFVSTVILGLYSNYTLFTTMIRTVITKIFEALTGSVGNLIAVGTKQQIYTTFRKIWFVNFWLVSFSCAALFALVNPFIELWVGSTYLLDEKVVLMVCVNLYMRLIRNTFIVFNDTCGMFRQLKVKCVAEAILNLLISLILVGPLELGIYGVLMGTFISNLATNFWYEPYLLFKKVFEKNYSGYFLQFGQYLGQTIVSGTIAKWICNSLIKLSGWAGFACKLIATTLFINCFYVLIFSKTEEFAYLITAIKGKFKRSA